MLYAFLVHVHVTMQMLEMLVGAGFWDLAELVLWRLFTILVDHVDVLKPMQALEGRRRIHAHQGVIFGARQIFVEQRVAFVV